MAKLIWVRVKGQLMLADAVVPPGAQPLGEREKGGVDAAAMMMMEGKNPTIQGVTDRCKHTAPQEKYQSKEISELINQVRQAIGELIKKQLHSSQSDTELDRLKAAAVGLIEQAALEGGRQKKRQDGVEKERVAQRIREANEAALAQLTGKPVTLGK